MALSASVLLYGHLSVFPPFSIRLSPPENLRYDVCAAVRPPLQGTEGCARPTAVCFIPLHAGASTCRNNRYSAIWASCLVVAPDILLVPSAVSPACHRQKESPFCLPGRPFLLPAQAVIPFIRCLLYRPLANSCSICDYCLLSFLVCHRIGFIGCECRLSRLILPF